MILDNPKAFAALLSDWVEVTCVRRVSGVITTFTGRVLCAVIPGEHIVPVQAGYSSRTGQKLMVTVATTYWPASDGPAYGDSMVHASYGTMTVQDSNPDGTDFWAVTCIANPKNKR